MHIFTQQVKEAIVVCYLFLFAEFTKRDPNIFGI